MRKYSDDFDITRYPYSGYRNIAFMVSGVLIIYQRLLQDDEGLRWDHIIPMILVAYDYTWATVVCLYCSRKIHLTISTKLSNSTLDRKAIETQRNLFKGKLIDVASAKMDYYSAAHAFPSNFPGHFHTILCHRWHVCDGFTDSSLLHRVFTHCLLVTTCHRTSCLIRVAEEVNLNHRNNEMSTFSVYDEALEFCWTCSHAKWTVSQRQLSEATLTIHHAIQNPVWCLLFFSHATKKRSQLFFHQVFLVMNKILWSTSPFTDNNNIVISRYKTQTFENKQSIQSHYMFLSQTPWRVNVDCSFRGAWSLLCIQCSYRSFPPTFSHSLSWRCSQTQFTILSSLPDTRQQLYFFSPMISDHFLLVDVDTAYFLP